MISTLSDAVLTSIQERPDSQSAFMRQLPDNEHRCLLVVVSRAGVPFKHVYRTDMSHGLPLFMSLRERERAGERGGEGVHPRDGGYAAFF